MSIVRERDSGCGWVRVDFDDPAIEPIVNEWDAAIGMALHAFFLGVRLMLATWPDWVTCPHCGGDGDGTYVPIPESTRGGVYEDCAPCRGSGEVEGDPSYRDALRRAGWTGPEVQS